MGLESIRTQYMAFTTMKTTLILFAALCLTFGFSGQENDIVSEDAFQTSSETTRTSELDQAGYGWRRRRGDAERRGKQNLRNAERGNKERASKRNEGKAKKAAAERKSKNAAAERKSKNAAALKDAERRGKQNLRNAERGNKERASKGNEGKAKKAAAERKSKNAAAE